MMALILAAAFAGLEPVEGPQFATRLRYASADNFLERDVYTAAGVTRCYVRPELLRALKKSAPALKAAGLKLLFWDCYRPHRVQYEMWKLVPDERYVADPKKGSSHNRAAAVDVTLAHADGSPVPMPTEFDEFTQAAAADYRCSPSQRQRCRHRDLLKSILADAGLAVLPTEWWHFQLPNPERYPIVEPAR